jgi:ferritin-like metal-binding protein YciE
MATQENPQAAISRPGNYIPQTGNRNPVMRDSKLHQFFMQQLQDIYWAEKKLVKVLPKLARAATSVTLKQAFNDHLDQTTGHVTRLENIFQLMGEEPKALKCPAMVGIAEEGEDIIDETDNGSAQRDVGLIFAAQKAEHYEIATYGGLVQLARTMGHSEAVELLEQTLAEEKVSDALLTRIAEEEANIKAFEERTD